MRFMAALAAALCAAAIIGLGPVGSAAARTPAKLALVIGNADYDLNGAVDVSEFAVAASEAAGFVPDLRNPMNDAADMRDALKAIGFSVDYVVNADGAAMSTALALFGAKVAEAPSDAQVVIYYAGHAIQVDGANFLIPVGAKLPAADFSRMPSAQAQTILGRVAVSTGDVLMQFREPAAPGVNILILDSCRNNPWERRMRGLVRTASQTRGMADLRANIARTVIAFATQPGDVAQDGEGRNSPYTGALKTKLAEPGTVLQTLDAVGEAVQQSTGGRQTPWFQSASVGQTCLTRCAVATADTGASEDVIIGAARTLGGDQLFRLYLEAFPNGRYASEARTAIAAAGPQMSVAERCEKLRVPVMVFFDWDSAVVTPEAHQVLEYFAQSTLPQLNFLRSFCGLSTIVVTGHTDAERSPEYSLGLSQRQARSVVTALAELGFPAESMVAVGKGWSEMVVPTAQGVREPLNRRVDISLSR